MAEITATMVKDLRERTGLPMMDCKQALTETQGDPDAAIELLRKRGAAAAEKKADRETAEGRLGSHVDREKNVAALVEVLCETAPTSNNPVFRELVANIARHAALTGDANPETIGGESFLDDPDRTVKDLINDVINRIRENMKVSRVVRTEGRAAAYIHHDGRVGVLIEVEGDGGDDALLSDVCMHIAAMRPMAASREEIPAEEVEKERAIVRQQVLDSGKPENLVDKIATGKMDRWFSERVLVEQPFVKDDKKTVGDVLKAAGVKVRRFTRIRVGEA